MEEEGSVSVLVQFGDSFHGDDVGMQDGQFLFEFEGNGDVGFFDILVGLEQYVMGSFVVPVLLLLGSNGHCNLGGISEVLEDPVESIGEDGVFGLSV